MVSLRSSHFDRLRDKWIAKHQFLQKQLWKKHKQSLKWIKNNTKELMLGSATGLLMLAHPTSASTLAQNLLPPPEPSETRPERSEQGLVAALSDKLPDPKSPLSPEQEKEVGYILTDYFHIPVTAELEGIKLNRSYGIIGAEQHLMRYPGDTMGSHFDSEEEKKYWSSGMAPGRGAWGYFTNSRSEMTDQDKNREKYYIAVQTFLAPGWEEDPKKLIDFFKYRKMLVVNPENGKAIVAMIADSGPAAWTGKHLGGSPEVMFYLERQDGRARGPVLYFFIFDPENKIPLGPLKI